MGDHFSKQADSYAKYRPNYPEELYEFIMGLVSRDTAMQREDIPPNVGMLRQGIPPNGEFTVWDCATGNGQAAIRLAKDFAQVEATDISETQIENAIPASNIHYQVCKAEETPFENDSFDLVTVAQAIHWFDHDRFYQEVQRVAKPGAYLAVWGYFGCKVNEGVNKVYSHYYREITGPYWPKQRKIIENQYRDLPFPFEEIPTPEFAIRLHWDMEDLLGYMWTWSATQRYINEKNENPLDLIREEMAAAWRDQKKKKEVVWPMVMKVGRIT